MFLNGTALLLDACSLEAMLRRFTLLKFSLLASPARAASEYSDVLLAVMTKKKHELVINLQTALFSIQKEQNPSDEILRNHVLTFQAFILENVANTYTLSSQPSSSCSPAAPHSVSAQCTRV